jgi:class 3 adenylate cyclase
MPSIHHLYRLLFLLLLPVATVAQQPVAVKGVLDLRSYSFETKAPVALKGEWNFHWQQFMTAAPKAADTAQPFMRLPELWNGYQWKGQKIKGDGYASFHLKLLLPPDKKLYSLDIPYMYTAYRMYVDSFIVAENGRVGNTSEKHDSRFLPQTTTFLSNGGETHIIIQVSNFDDRKGGIWKVPQLGSPGQVATNRTKKLALEFFLIGALVLIGLYQIGLAFIRKEDRSSLYFGSFCLMMGINSLFVGSVFIHYIFPGMDWHWVSRLEYISMYCMPVTFFLFINALFPGYVKKNVPRIFVSLTTMACLFILFTQKKTFGMLLEFLLLMVAAMAFFTFRVVIKAIKDRKYGSRNALAGIIIIVLFTLNDILFGLEMIHTGNYRQYGLLIFVVIQSLNIAYVFSEAFNDVKRLTQNLKLTNLSLSRFVPEAFLRFLGKKDITDVQLGDQKRANMAILFTDIRSFTTLSETMSPKDNFQFINSYFSKISPVIRRHGGFVDKFIGDAIMSLFPDSPAKAIEASLGILAEVDALNQLRAIDGLAPVRVGMGLHAGWVMLGTVGEEERMDTTVISDAVNLAARLEGLAKLFDMQVLTTLTTIEALENREQFPYRIIHKGKVKGKQQAITLVEILTPVMDEHYETKLKLKPVYENAMLLYQQGKLAEALEGFLLVANKLPADKPAKYYIRLCKQYLASSLPENWTGVESLDVRVVEV